MAARRLLTLFCLVLLAGCGSGSSFEPASSGTKTTTLSPCTLNSYNAAPCQLNVTSTFVYDQAYGGRAALGTNGTATAGSLVAAIVDGWHDGTTSVLFSDPALATLAPSKIRSGVNIFGITGTLSTTNLPACDTSSGGGLQSSECTIGAGNYLYANPNGGSGRDTSCTNIDTNTTTSAACWLNGTGLSVTTTTTAQPNCSAMGSPISSDCTLKKDSSYYWYTQPYGGRPNCGAGTTITSACWLTVPAGNSYQLLDTVTTNDCGTGLVTDPSCSLRAGAYVYNSVYGGRNTLCTGTNLGNCWADVATITSLEPALAPAIIKNGATIFGIVGTYMGEGVWGSAAHRDVGSSQVTIVSESSIYAGSSSSPDLPPGYHPVPKIANDDDGGDIGTVTPVDRSGWGQTACGIAGTLNTIENKISDCAGKFGPNASWSGKDKGNAGQGDWRLVSRSAGVSGGKGREVWRDERTGLVWSSALSLAINWCQASGASGADPSSICSSATYQTAAPITSACYEPTSGTAYTRVSGAIDSAGLSGLQYVPADGGKRVRWRIPTLYDYEVADYNGLRFVMPDMGLASQGVEWTATTRANQRREAWTFESRYGGHSFLDRSLTAVTRCIGRHE